MKNSQVIYVDVILAILNINFIYKIIKNVYHSFYVVRDTGGVTLSYTNNFFKDIDNKYFIH